VVPEPNVTIPPLLGPVNHASLLLVHDVVLLRVEFHQLVFVVFHVPEPPKAVAEPAGSQVNAVAPAEGQFTDSQAAAANRTIPETAKFHNTRGFNRRAAKPKTEICAAAQNSTTDTANSPFKK
jgi:hypothetical protein